MRAGYDRRSVHPVNWATLIGLVVQACAVAWWAGHISALVESIEERVARIEYKLDSRPAVGTSPVPPPPKVFEEGR